MARRHWELDLADGHHVVDLVHGYFLGTRTYVVDGAKTVQRAVPFTNHAGEHAFPFPAHEARLRITTNGFKYYYDLIVDGREISEGGTIARPRVGGPGSQRLIGALIVVIAVPLLAFFGKIGYDEYRYHTTNATALGTVEDKRIVRGRYGDSHRLTYQWVDDKAAIHRDSDDVSRATYDQARVGSQYYIQYLPDEPGVNRFAGKDEAVGTAGLLSANVAGLGLGVWMFVAGSRRLATIKRVNSGGQPTTATVTKLKKAKLQHVGRTVTVEYEYDDPFGRRRRGPRTAHVPRGGGALRGRRLGARPDRSGPPGRQPPPLDPVS